MKKIHFSAPVFIMAMVLLGAGCTAVKNDAMQEKNIPTTTDTQNNQQAMMEQKQTPPKKNEGNTMMTDTKNAMNTFGTYADYTLAKLAMAKNGPTILFFKATWCPTCKGVDEDITTHLQDIPAAVSILKVDYDTQTELKKKYAVTYQHTFVQVDPNGNMIKKWSGSPTLADIVKEIKL